MALGNQLRHALYQTGYWDKSESWKVVSVKNGKKFKIKPNVSDFEFKGFSSSKPVTFECRVKVF